MEENQRIHMTLTLQRLTNFGIFLLSISVALTFYNFGYLLLPDMGLVSITQEMKPELLNVAYRLFACAVLSLFTAALSLVGIFWKTKVQLISLLNTLLLFVVVTFGLWSFSSFFFAFC